MTKDEHDAKLLRLENLLDKPRETQTQLAMTLCEIWLEKLWEASEDSFDEFLQQEFQMGESDAFMAMKMAATDGVFSEMIVDKIDKEIELL